MLDDVLDSETCILAQPFLSWGGKRKTTNVVAGMAHGIGEREAGVVVGHIRLEGRGGRCSS